jgi:flagellar hook assembly protein FlgD
VEITVYGVDGALVRRLSASDLPAGRNRVAWDGTDENGRRVASGTYLVKLAGSGFETVGRVTVVR